jgi:DNA-binding MarR family transcriptional regulator
MQRRASANEPLNSGEPETAAVIHAAAFRSALRRFLRVSEKVARSQGLTPQRQLLLLMIKGTPDGSERTTVTELGERLQLAQSTATELVSRAEEVGLIERQPSDTDARVGYLCLTAEGERRFAATFIALEVERAQLREALAELEP